MLSALQQIPHIFMQLGARISFVWLYKMKNKIVVNGLERCELVISVIYAWHKWILIVSLPAQYFS